MNTVTFFLINRIYVIEVTSFRCCFAVFFVFYFYVENRSSGLFKLVKILPNFFLQLAQNFFKS